MPVNLFPSVHDAARLAVIQPDYRRSAIKPARWAETYHCAPEDVEEALNIAENGSRKLPEERAVHAIPEMPTEEETDE